MLSNATNQPKSTVELLIHTAKICRQGRTTGKFRKQGTGTNLYLQTSTDPIRSTKVPPRENRLGTPWIKGKCFPAMGICDKICIIIKQI